MRSASIFAALFLAGCMPYVRSYLYLDAPGIAHEQEVCGAGPPAWAVMTVRNVTVKVTIDPGAASRTKLPLVKVFAPHGTPLEVAEPIAYFEAEGRRHPVEMRPLSSSTDYGPHDLYRYDLAGEPPTSKGRLELPALRIDGERVALPALTFDRRAYAGFLPLNC